MSDPERERSETRRRRGEPLLVTGEAGVHTVRDPEAAALLSDPTWLVWLEPFLGRTCGAAEAAHLLGRPLDQVRYRIRRFLRAGVLREVDRVPRAGRPIRRYRSVADTFVVPFDATPFADLEERLLRSLAAEASTIARAGARALRERGMSGRVVTRDEEGRFYSGAHLIEEPGDGFEPFESYVGAARLSRERAAHLLAEFRRLCAEAEHEEATDGSGPVRRYRIGFHLVPLAPNELLV